MTAAVVLKWALCAALCGFSSLAGFLKASSYSQRVRLLARLETNLKYLETEMGYRKEPLPGLLKKIGEHSGDTAGDFFIRTAELLLQRESLSLRDAWCKSIEETLPEDILTEEDRMILSELGYELGGTDMESQSAMFAHCFSGLSSQLEGAKSERRLKGRMYRGLGVSLGVLAAVLFL